MSYSSSISTEINHSTLNVDQILTQNKHLLCKHVKRNIVGHLFPKDVQTFTFHESDFGNQ